MIKIFFISGILFFTLTAHGQDDSILRHIRKQLPTNWDITVTKTNLVISSTDSIGVLVYNPQIYDSESTTSEVVEPSITPTITYELFEIADYSKLDSTLNRIKCLNKVIEANFEKCYVDPCDITFVQYRTSRGAKRAARKRERKERRRKSKCVEYDKAEVELTKLLDQTPIYFSENYALGTADFNWENGFCKNWIIRILKNFQRMI